MFLIDRYPNHRGIFKIRIGQIKHGISKLNLKDTHREHHFYDVRMYHCNLLETTCEACVDNYLQKIQI